MVGKFLGNLDPQIPKNAMKTKCTQKLFGVRNVLTSEIVNFNFKQNSFVQNYVIFFKYSG